MHRLPPFVRGREKIERTASLQTHGQSRLPDRRRRQRRRHPRSAALRGSGNTRPAARGRRRHAARCYSPTTSPTLFRARISTQATSGPTYTRSGRPAHTATLPAGAHHGRRLERDGLVGIARASSDYDPGPRTVRTAGAGRMSCDASRGFEYDADRDRSQSASTPTHGSDGAALLSDPPPAAAQEWPAFVTAIEVCRRAWALDCRHQRKRGRWLLCDAAQPGCAARLERALLSHEQRAPAQQPGHHAAHARRRAADRWSGGARGRRRARREYQAARRARGHPERGRDTFSDNHAARGHRSGGPAEGSGDSPAGRPARGRSQFAEPSLSAFRADASAWPPAGSSSAPVRHRRHGFRPGWQAARPAI